MCAENICPCHNPPGGYHECPANHLAVCYVRDGVAHGYCYPVTRAMLSRMRERGVDDPEVVRWVMAKLFPDVGPIESKTRFELELGHGRILDRETGAVVNFKLPSSPGNPGSTTIGRRSPQKPPAFSKGGTAKIQVKAKEYLRAYVNT
jgi:hypothetical protein